MAVPVKQCDHAFQELGPLAGPPQSSRACRCWRPGFSWVQSRILLGPVLKFWRLWELFFYIRFTNCCCSNAAPVRLSGDARVNAGKRWEGVSPSPAPRRAPLVQSRALCPCLLFLLQRLHWSLPGSPLLMSELEGHPYSWVIPAPNFLWFQAWDQDSELKSKLTQNIVWKQRVLPTLWTMNLIPWAQPYPGLYGV